MAMTRATRERVTTMMKAWAETQAPKLQRWKEEDLSQSYPFHRLIFTNEDIAAARAERSIVTNMGNAFYPKLAEAIAQGRFNQVYLEHTIESELNDASCNLIEQIVTELRAPTRRRTVHRQPDQDTELNDILSSRGGGVSPRSVTADLYIGDFPDGPLFVELKSPLPNLDMTAESKRKMMYFLAMMNRLGNEGARAFLGLTYNPFGARSDYDHPYTKRIMDMEKEVLIGPELWDYIGGPGTYDELLEIIAEINPL